VKKLFAVLLLGTALATPDLALARDITIAGQMRSYSGPEAYLAVYLTDKDGTYKSTLYVAGHKTKYYRQIGGWARFAARDENLQLDGITGASIGSGRSFSIDLSIADSLIDAGYTIHIDTAVENLGGVSDDAILPLDSGAAGIDVAGTGFVGKARVQM